MYTKCKINFFNLIVENDVILWFTFDVHYTLQSSTRSIIHYQNVVWLFMDLMWQKFHFNKSFHSKMYEIVCFKTFKLEAYQIRSLSNRWKCRVYRDLQNSIKTFLSCYLPR